MPHPSTPIKTGICAFGMSGRVFHAPFLDCMDEFEFTAVTERHTKKAQNHYPDVKSYDSIEDLFADNALELIVVNTPNVTHFDYVKRALEAGKHVVVEKPFTPTVEEAEQLIEIAAKNNRKLIVFQNRRWDSDFQSVKQVVKNQELGQLIDAEFHYDRYKIEFSAKKHKEVSKEGVGLLYDLGPHLIDQAIHLFGKPEQVFARIQSHRPGSKVDDYFQIHLLYPDFNCTLKSSLLVKEQLPGYRLHGTEGSFIKTRADVQESDLIKGASPCQADWGQELPKEKGILHTEKEGETSYRKIASPNGDYKLFYQKVFSSIRNNGKPPVSLEDSLLVMRVIEVAKESSEGTKVIELD